MTKLKLCGIRTIADLEVCRNADYLGFVVLSDSPRNLEVRRAKELMSVCEGKRVAVTTERREDALADLVRALDPDVLQLHSPLDRGLLSRIAVLGVPIWGMLPVSPDVDVDLSALPFLQALVLDSPGPRAGGSGRTHDWTLSRFVRDRTEGVPVVLAGGLNAENVQEAIRAVRPYAVDISSGAEGSGGKDPFKVTMIIEAMRGADT